MDQTFTCLQTDSTDPFYNLAFEEYVLTHLREGDYLILWQNDNTIVIGLNQNTEAEINRPFVEEHGIRVVRRTTGGGAVYHDLGNLNYSFITDAEKGQEAAKARFTGPVVEALRGLGLDAEVSGRNDILANGKKVSGTAQRIDHGRILHHGTLLFDSDPNRIAGALRADPEKLRAKGIRSVKSRVGNIRPLLKEDMDIQAFKDYLRASLGGSGAASGQLEEGALSEIRRLRDEKYNTWEWNYGRSPQGTLHAKSRFEGGTVEVSASLVHDRIEDIRFFGDFLARAPQDELCAALKGCPFKKDDVAAVLAAFPLADLFGSVSGQDLLSLLFS